MVSYDLPDTRSSKKEKKENRRVFTLILRKRTLVNVLQKYKRGSNPIPDHNAVWLQYFFSEASQSTVAMLVQASSLPLPQGGTFSSARQAFTLETVALCLGPDQESRRLDQWPRDQLQHILWPCTFLLADSQRCSQPTCLCVCFTAQFSASGWGIKPIDRQLLGPSTDLARIP